VLNRLDGPDFDRVMCIARQIWIRRNKLVFKGEFIHSKTVTQIAVEQLDFILRCHIRVMVERGLKVAKF
jgi:hypothetical protein